MLRRCDNSKSDEELSDNVMKAVESIPEPFLGRYHVKIPLWRRVIMNLLTGSTIISNDAIYQGMTERTENPLNPDRQLQ
jgi:hypothetical protein